MGTRDLKKIDTDRIELDSAEMQQALRSPCRYESPCDVKTQLCSIRHNESATLWENMVQMGGEWSKGNNRKVKRMYQPLNIRKRTQVERVVIRVG